MILKSDETNSMLYINDRNETQTSCNTELNTKQQELITKKSINKQKIYSWQSFCNTTASVYWNAFKLTKKKYLRNTDAINSVLESSKHSDTFFYIQHSILDFHFRINPPEDIHTFRNSHIFSPEEINNFKITLREIKILHILTEQQESTRIRQNWYINS